jgi:hypothetical protein
LFRGRTVPGGIVALRRCSTIRRPTAAGSSEITRLDTPEGRKPSADLYLQTARQAAARGRAQTDTRPGDLVPVPLTADLWSTAIFHRTVSPRELVTTIVADRSAALLCLGLTSLDDGTLAFFADHPLLLERIYERSAPAFAALSASLHVQGNRVMPPGAVRPSTHKLRVALSRVEGVGPRVAPESGRGRQAEGRRDDVIGVGSGHAREGHARGSFHPAAGRADQGGLRGPP